MTNIERLNARLVRPDILYKESYVMANEEFLHEDGRKNLSADQMSIEFDTYLQTVIDNEKGKELPEQFDKQIVFWLIDDKQYIGRAVIRHRVIEQGLHNGWHIGYSVRPSKRQQGYGSLILKLGLQEAERLGIKKVFLVCDSDNLPSKTMIEKVGAHFEREVTRVKPEGKDRLEYSLQLS